MAISAKLRNLISASAPLWAGEAEVVRTYWDSPVRTHATDLLWMRRQCSKEFNGTGLGEYKNLGVFLGPVTEIKEAFGDIDSGVDRHHVLDLIETLHDEFEHYVLIADIYDAPSAAPTSRRSMPRPWRPGPRTRRWPIFATSTSAGTARSASAPACSPRAATAPCSARACGWPAAAGPTT